MFVCPSVHLTEILLLFFRPLIELGNLGGIDCPLECPQNFGIRFLI